MLIQFMIQGQEQKIEIADADPEQKIMEIKEKLVPLVSPLFTYAIAPTQIRLIYSGRILKDDQTVSSLLSKEVEPPITVILMVKPSDAPEREPSPDNEDEGCKCLLL